MSCCAITDYDTSNTTTGSICTTCSQIETAGAIQHCALKDATIDTCVNTQSRNCLIFSATLVDINYVCDLCRSGFFLNADKRCENINLPAYSDAVGSAFFKFSDTPTAAEFGNYGLLRNMSGQKTPSGCDNCNAGFVAIGLATNERKCVSSSYAQSNGYASVSGTKYITGCAKYKNLLDTTATFYSERVACKNNKIPTLNRKSCITAPSNACKTAQNTDNTKCQVCADTNVLVLGTCTPKNILNCKTYDITRPSPI